MLRFAVFWTDGFTLTFGCPGSAVNAFGVTEHSGGGDGG